MIAFKSRFRTSLADRYPRTLPCIGIGILNHSLPTLAAKDFRAQSVRNLGSKAILYCINCKNFIGPHLGSFALGLAFIVSSLRVPAGGLTSYRPKSPATLKSRSHLNVRSVIRPVFK